MEKSNIKPDSADEQKFQVLWRHSLFLLIQVSFRSRGSIFLSSDVYTLMLLCTQALYTHHELSCPHWCNWVCLKCKSLFVIFCFIGASRFTWHWFTNILLRLWKFADTIKVLRSVMPISLCSDRFPHHCLEGILRVNRAVILWDSVFLLLSLFWTNHTTTTLTTTPTTPPLQQPP